MEDLYITLVWHHAGVLCNGPEPKYVGRDITYEVNMDLDKLSIIEFQHTVREMGYTSV